MRPPLSRALWVSGLWIALALAFAAGLRWAPGGDPALALAFLTCYVVELTLSVDNIAVMLSIFRYFGVPAADQPRVLIWGVIGAIVMRLLFVAAGAALLQRFAWTVYVFAALLIVASIRMALGSDRGFGGNDSFIVRTVGRVIPISGQLAGRQFVAVVDGRRVLTPLAMALVVIEVTDIVFAVDSVPAAFAITRVAWIVYAANMFAVMGLRSMFTVVAGAVDRLRFLDRGLAVILLYVGVTMVTHPWVDVPTAVTLAVVTGVLALTALLSILCPTR
ncbi:MAG TPA: TerC/Alx family metal homeostasis membrane protein [Gemmatimonadaceae bacterium]|nr:TerC/Alx family metal homeostasis membrane protein [Gemmatimonadaceae bacterium]